MGYRTVVVLNNDQSTEWMNDPALGKKIHNAAAQAYAGHHGHPMRFACGEVIEQVHADTQTLMVIDGLSGMRVTGTSWHRGQTEDQRDLTLLKQFAESLGYSVRKKSVTKPKTVTT